MSSTVLPPAAPVAAFPGPRRAPFAVVAAAVVAVVEALALLALGLTGLDGLLASAGRPSGAALAVGLLVLAAWVVLCAGGGASLVDGAGRLLLLVVSGAEVVLLLTLGVAGLVVRGGMTPVPVGGLGAVPLPALALLGLAVPVGKMLLAGSPSALAWLAAGPAPARPAPAAAPDRRRLRLGTVAAIGVALTAFAVFGSPAPAGTAPQTAPAGDVP